MGMFDLGVLILGDSGGGKSECALDLIDRGHRLVADDSVQVRRIGETLEARSPVLTEDCLEIRGLGIINVRDVFGASAVVRESNIDLCLELKHRNEMEDVDRLGLDLQCEKLLDISLPKFVLPVSSGRNLATLAETAVRVYLLKKDGKEAARELVKKHNTAVSGSN